MAQSPIRINFPGGAGGHWLLSVLLIDPMLTTKAPHWHHIKHVDTFKLVHNLDERYEILFSGNFYFTFYLNVLFKTFHLGQLFEPGYQARFDKLFEVARWLCDWHSIHGKKHADLFFDDLIADHLTFYHNLVKIQQSQNVPCIDLDDFERRRALFFETCVNTDKLFENFDNMTFVVFVLAWLERQGRTPHEQSHFIMNDPANQRLCKKFARDNYDLCPSIKNHVFQSGIKCPEFLGNF
jgi:hypothetical protein